MTEHAIFIMQGSEYPGETYIDCACNAQFDGESFDALEEWIAEHRTVKTDS